MPIQVLDSYYIRKSKGLGVLQKARGLVIQQRRNAGRIHSTNSTLQAFCYQSSHKEEKIEKRKEGYSRRKQPKMTRSLWIDRPNHALSYHAAKPDPVINRLGTAPEPNSIALARGDFSYSPSLVTSSHLQESCKLQTACRPFLSQLATCQQHRPSCRRS